MKRRAHLKPFILLLVVLAGCQPTHRVSRINIAGSYQPGSQFSQFKATVYHSSDSISTLYLEVPLEGFEYRQDDRTGKPTAEYRVSYHLVLEKDAKTVADSAAWNYRDSIHYGNKISLVYTYPLRAMNGQNYLLEAELEDLLSRDKARIILAVDKKVVPGIQSFLALGESNRPLFRDYIGPGERVRIIGNARGIDSVRVEYFRREFQPSRPPFVQEKAVNFDYRPDSIFYMALTGGETDWFTLDREGFYQFRPDTTSRDGLTLYRFHDGYPLINRAAQLIFPLRYITTQEEYKELNVAPDPKMAADEFWLKTAGNPARAKTLIEKYYTFVEEANTHFTSYQEGWKTDRGIIYVVFGRPTYVYRDFYQEEWIYGEPQNRSSLRFTFERVENPFTLNDYLLLRSPTMKDAWYITVQSWRR